MHTTMEPVVQEPTRSPSTRTWPWLVAVAVALLLGLFGGWLWWGGSDGQPAVVTRNGAEPTERQMQMVDVTKQYVAAWQANDGDAAAAFMTPSATFSHPELNDEYLLADGSFQRRVSETAAYSSMKIHEPMLIDGDHLVLLGRIDSMDLEFLSVIDFTSAEEPLIQSEVVYFVH